MKFLRKKIKVVIAICKIPFFLFKAYKEQNKMVADIATKLNEKFDGLSPEEITPEEFSKGLKEVAKPYEDAGKVTTPNLPDLPESNEADIRREI